MGILTGLAVAMLATTQQPQTPVPAPPAAASAPAQQGDPAELGEVLVVSPVARDLASNFVERIGAPASSRRLARWHEAVCVSVANLPAAPAQYLVDRVSGLAEDLGLGAGEPGCTANVVIILTTDAPAVAEALVKEHRNAFDPGGSGMTLSNAALENFKTAERAVRWWHVSIPTDSETGQRAVRLPGEDAPVTNVSRASRLRSDIRDDLNKAIIIVDVDKIGAATFPQLADYVAMVALAQIDAGASTSGLPTVLNLFEDPQGTPGLTDWDLAYLTALYNAEPNRSTAQGQAGDIAGLMLQARAAGE